MTENVYSSHQGLILKVMIKSKLQILPMTHCKKCASNFKKPYFEENYKTGYFDIIDYAVWFHVFQ